MQTYFFTAQQMTVGYDGVPLIRDIGITLKKGEILTLIGEWNAACRELM